MKTTNGVYINIEDVPASWKYCFCEGCPQHDDCLRFQTGLLVPDKLTWGTAVYPTAYKNGDCPHFKAVRLMHAAYGFEPLFREVKQKDYTMLRDMIKKYLGSHNTYYRYNRGELLLTPEQQQWILQLFERHGYTENLHFEHYRDVVDFTE